ncbi:type II secretion system F family protein [Duganella sp. Root198D2]|uniref:type II secretion system F family protein n=1 Tax=Duganella sp. Root198D2 TaxID=1736489 RepID=UPI00070E9DB2|nr:type II secretion system F family protein [Duganella sp. Root198D2]KRC02530.1 pilus assembly protein TadB [Duganella sp. Root198D2]
MDFAWTGFSVLLFAAVICLCEAAWLWWSSTHGHSAQRIARRLRLMSGRTDTAGGAISILKERRYAKAPALDALLRRIPHIGALDRLLLQAGLRWQVARFLQVQAGAALAGLLAPAAVHMPPLPSIIVGVLSLAAPAMLLLRTRAARVRRIESQLPEMADFLARGLRAGHSFANVMQMAGDEVADPLGGEFRATYEEVNFGVTMQDALHSLAARVPLTDLRYLVIAVLIQRESGGNLAELLDNVSRMTRARLQLLAQVRVMSAEGRMSAWVLTLMPLGLMAAMQVSNPKYSAVLWQDPGGQRMLWYGACAMVAGMLWMRQVIRVRV